MSDCESELALRYLDNLERTLSRFQSIGSDVLSVVEEARRYLHDGRYYFKKKSYLTALVAASYAEGLLDCLKLLGLADVSWSNEEYDDEKIQE